MKNLLLACVIATGVLATAGCGSKNSDPAPTPIPTTQAVAVTIIPQGGSTYVLGSGIISYAQYDAIKILLVNGTLSDGSKLQLRFGDSGGPANETNVLEATVNAVAATGATGRTVYTPATKKVSGTFSCTLPTGKAISGSFADTPVVIR